MGMSVEVYGCVWVCFWHFWECVGVCGCVWRLTPRSAPSTNSASYSRLARPRRWSSAPRDVSVVGPVVKWIPINGIMNNALQSIYRNTPDSLLYSVVVWNWLYLWKPAAREKIGAAISNISLIKKEISFPYSLPRRYLTLQDASTLL